MRCRHIFLYLLIQSFSCRFFYQFTGRFLRIKTGVHFADSGSVRIWIVSLCYQSFVYFIKTVLIVSVAVGTEDRQFYLEFLCEHAHTRPTFPR